MKSKPHTWRCSCSVILPRWGKVVDKKLIRCKNCLLVYNFKGELAETLNFAKEKYEEMA